MQQSHHTSEPKETQVTIASTLSQIKHAEALIADTRLDISDSWRTVGSMLRDLRRAKSLTQAQAAALVARDAAIVQRWERGIYASVEDIQNYIKKLEEHK